MNRRDFLKLAVGALASVGLKLKDKSPEPETVEVSTGELEVHRWQTAFDGGLPFKDYWPMDGLLALKLCDALYVRSMTTDGTFLESFDLGATWREVIPQPIDSDWELVDYANLS